MKYCDHENFYVCGCNTVHLHVDYSFKQTLFAFKVCKPYMYLSNSYTPVLYAVHVHVKAAPVNQDIFTHTIFLPVA